MLYASFLATLAQILLPLLSHPFYPLHTGDIGYYDHSGNIYICDRLKELIKVKGLQVAPAELEDVIRSIPEVTDVAVIGIDHDRDGEVPRAYVVTSGPELIPSQVENY